MAKKLMMSVTEVMDELDISRSSAYKIMKKMNDDLAQKGYMVVNGKVSRKYFEEQFYGMVEMRRE